MHYIDQYVPFLFLLRVPIFFLLAALLLPAIALKVARPLLQNFYDLDPRGAFYSVLAVLALSWTTVLTGYTVLRHDERFGPDYIGWQEIGPGWMIAGPFALAVIPTILAMRRRMGAGFTRTHWRACLGAIAAGLLIAWVNEQMVVSVVPWVRVPVPDSWLGYSNDGMLSSSHVFAIGAFLCSMAAYLVLGAIPRPRVPTLAYLNIALCILCWFLSGAAFFFDGYRIPLVLGVGAVLFVSGYVLHRKSDHFFRVEPCKSKGAPLPQDVLAAGPDDPVIIVAANGGGIQSAAWTSRVLCGLDRKWRDVGADPTRFRRAVRLVSGVSGGSVGAMHFLSTYDGVDDERAVENANTSSLEDVAWGLLYPDLWNLILPMRKTALHDRGNALEGAWLRTGANGIDQPLSAHYDEVRTGKRPAVVYNATITETGERVLLGTTSITERPGDGRRNLRDIVPDGDVRSVTAARLSATFPFVTPVARPHDGKPGGFHMADGGYYDNYGTVTAVEWLDEALSNMQRRPARVLFLELHGAPPDPEPEGSSRGWAYQLIAPILCMLSVRTAGQLAHKTLELDFLRRKWADRGVNIEYECFEFKRPDPPLSWHLTAAEKAAIDQEFESSTVESATVRKFLESSVKATA